MKMKHRLGIIERALRKANRLFSLFETLSGPSATTGESRMLLNGIWRFLTDPDHLGEIKAWYSASLNDFAWEALTVPGNWDTMNAYSSYRGKGWYRRTFEAPSDYLGYTVCIRFDAVYHHTKVWLNGTYLGEHSGGYTPFEFDVSALLNYGSTNTITVMADNSYQVGAWWPWGGIIRDVHLIVNHKVRIQWQKVTSTPDLIHGSASIHINVKVLNCFSRVKTINVECNLYDKASGSLIWSSANDKNLTASASVNANSHVSVSLHTKLPASKVKLWHFDFPHLYRMETSLLENTVLKHQVSNPFGIRKIELSGTQFRLNGEPVRLVGFNRVPSNRVTGNTEPKYLVKADIDSMKNAGANMARIHHVPNDSDLLDYIDEKGMLNIGEIPVWGKEDIHVTKDNPEARQWLKEMIERDYNHPSIVGWSVANEIPGDTAAGQKYVKSMFDYIRTFLDSSRILTYASNTAAQAGSPIGDAAQYCDIISLNSYGNQAENAIHVHRLWPDKPIFFTEYGPSGFNNEDPNIGNVQVDSLLNLLRDKEYIVGASLWTWNDYRSDYAGTPASENRPWGVVTVWRQRKRGYENARKANSPVKAMRISHSVITFRTGTRVKTAVTVNPKGMIAADLPSYTMKGYKLKWQIYDNHYKSEGGIIDLPQLYPGNSPWTGYLLWTVPMEGVLQQKITIVTPTNYEVYEKNDYFNVPAAPTIQEVLVASGTVRIIFHKVNGASAYNVKYGMPYRSAKDFMWDIPAIARIYTIRSNTA
ncbi:glycoside hydrolase family 2 protein [Paenibacillus sp. Soil522]|uniref:glycoside hydrolase family 2 protein n=1 Tax=Paenibacillus sp. Soil522 TaxID=1736388 RepID=UPI0006F388D2|nr:glycoside hydrolase family 2 [Paenibacillus sp. Soil522]KRE29831.1 hypothetical protein ASG81_26440 [Paenibacillus sp. Soil522]